MNSGATFNDRGLSPELYQAAREAARRAGMSVEDWLSATFGKAAVASASKSSQQPGAEGESLKRGGEKLTDTVAKLNARLEQLTASLDARPQGASGAPRGAPPLAPEEPGLDQVIAEIAARQRALEEAPIAPATTPAAAASVPPRDRAYERRELEERQEFEHQAYERQQAVAGPDLSGLEKQLSQIAAQIETLRRPCGVEDVVNALRSELAEVARAVGDAQPRRALEGLQADMHSLAERIERGYDRGVNPSAFEGIERRLSQVQDRLDAMTPAEALAGFDQRITELTHKIDGIGHGPAAAADPELVRYLEAAINEMRELSHGVASAEGVAALAGDVQALGARIDHIAATTGAAGLDSLSQRIDDLTHALDSRVEQVGPLPTNLQSLVESLTDKVGSSRVDLQACKLEYSIVSPK